MAESKQLDEKRHFLPAAVISCFSDKPEPLKRRESMVYILRKSNGTTRKDKAKNVGYGKRIYGYGKGRVHDHDNLFKGGEVMALKPVDRLLATHGPWFNANDWIKLAWYITTQINRGPDLEAELAKLISGNGWDATTASVGYPLNGQRISSAVLRARWKFIRSPNQNFILGDRGIAGFYHGDWKSYAYFVPLRKDFGVLLGPAPHKKQLKWANKEWQINISSDSCTINMTDLLNCYMYHAARADLYGPDEKQLIQIAQQATSMPPEIRSLASKYEGAQLLGLTVGERMKDEMLLLSLLGGIREPKTGDTHNLVI